MNEVHARVASALGDRIGEVVIHDHSSFPAEIRSPDDFSQAAGIPLRRVTKSLFLSRRDGGYAIVVAGMDRRIDFKRVAAALGVPRVEVASPTELEAVLGYPQHGVSPLGIPQDVPIVLDARLLELPTITVGGGAAGIEVELAPGTLRSLVRPLVSEICK